MPTLVKNVVNTDAVARAAAAKPNPTSASIAQTIAKPAIFAFCAVGRDLKPVFESTFRISSLSWFDLPHF